MLVDSGADYCILDNDVADFLGINIKDGQQIKTSGIEIKTRCSFIDGKLVDGKIAGVLGRQGFFEHFKVCINEKAKEIELK